MAGNSDSYEIALNTWILPPDHGVSYVVEVSQRYGIVYLGGKWWHTWRFLGRLGRALSQCIRQPGCKHVDCRRYPEMALACVDEKRRKRASISV